MKALALLLLCLVGCVSERTLPATQVLVVVASDRALVARLTSLRIDVLRADGSGEPVSSLTLPKSGKLQLPLSVGVARAGADSFRVVVTGYEGDARVVEQKAIARFEDERTLRLELFLSSACVGTFCASSEEACSPLANGACGPIATDRLEEVEPNGELVGVDTPAYDASAPREDATVSMPDAGEMHDAFVAVVDAGSADAGSADAGSEDAGCNAVPLCRPGPQSIAAGDGHTCALRSDGSVACWGFFGDRGTLTKPTTVAGVANAVALAAGKLHDCALLANGSVSCWGDNQYGQLGAGAAGAVFEVPVAPRGLNAVGRLYAGPWHSCVLDGAGAVQCWGEQLGAGTGASGPVGAPTKVEGIDNVKMLALAVGHTCAVKLDGAVWCWGQNDYGQVGDGSKDNALAPVRVAVTDATEVAAGDGYSCALAASGLWCWGELSYVDVAGGPELVGFRSLVPTKLPTPAGAHGLTSGGAHLCVLDSDERLWCRGFNRFGQLGVGSFTSANDFVKTQQLETFDSLALGWGHSCVRLREGGTRCWGQNNLFQLGLGNNTDVWLPTALPEP